MADGLKTLTLSVLLASNISKESGIAEGSLRKLIGVTDFLQRAMKDAAGSMNLLAKTVQIGALLFAGSALTSLVRLNQEINLSSFRYFQVRKDVDNYRNSLFKASKEGQVAIDVLNKTNLRLFDAGLKARLTNDQISKLSVQINKLSFVTGVSIDEFVELSATLVKYNADTEAVNETLNTVNLSMNLTRKEFSGLLNIIKEVTPNIVLFNREARNSQAALAQSIKGVSELSGSLLKLGAAQGDVGELMKTLTDPSKFLQSGKAMMMLGLNLNDVNRTLKGTGGQLEVINKITDSLESYSQMGDIAFGNLLDQIGMSRDMAATLMTNRDRIQETMKAQADLNATWKDAKMAAGGLDIAWNNFVTRFLTSMQPLANAITPVLKYLSKWLDSQTSFSMSLSKMIPIVQLIFFVFKQTFTGILKLIGDGIGKGLKFKDSFDGIKRSLDGIGSSANTAGARIRDFYTVVETKSKIESLFERRKMLKASGGDLATDERKELVGLIRALRGSGSSRASFDGGDAGGGGWLAKVKDSFKEMKLNKKDMMIMGSTFGGIVASALEPLIPSKKLSASGEKKLGVLEGMLPILQMAAPLLIGIPVVGPVLAVVAAIAPVIPKLIRWIWGKEDKDKQEAENNANLKTIAENSRKPKGQFSLANLERAYGMDMTAAVAMHAQNMAMYSKVKEVMDVNNYYMSKVVDNTHNTVRGVRAVADKKTPLPGIQV